jgi:membrane protease subunit (stomatin/prohibitin family)
MEEIKMDPTRVELPEDLSHLSWGTITPVTVMLGGEITSLRARGTCSLAISHFGLFNESSQDMETLRAMIRSYIPLRVAEVLADPGAVKNSLAEMIADTAGLESNLKSRLDADLDPFGLVVHKVVIEAVQRI